MRREAIITEVRRTLDVCNACRYCNGYCPTMQAIERRRSFTDADLRYLANLCHNCGSCLDACQYAPPHAFAIAVPQVLARLRGHSYADYAWPRPMAALFRGNGFFLTLLTLALVVLSLVTAPAGRPGQGFYDVVPWGTMTALAGVSVLWSCLALVMAFRNGWRDAGLGGWRDLKSAVPDMLSLRHLGGGAGQGCDHPAAPARRWFHHALLAGLALCFAATTVATLYHHALGLLAPYPLTSLPVLLGTAGGVLMVVGAAGLWAVKPKTLSDPAQAGGDRAFLALLFLVAASGLALLAWREAAAMAVLLHLHLALVIAFFLALPYSRFVHGLHRAAALVRWAAERRA